jgi:hypothetical protein
MIAKAVMKIKSLGRRWIFSCFILCLRFITLAISCLIITQQYRQIQDVDDAVLVNVGLDVGGVVVG